MPWFRKPILAAVAALALAAPSAAVEATAAQIRGMSPMLPGDDALSCAGVKAAVDQLTRNVAAIEAEIADGETALSWMANAWGGSQTSGDSSLLHRGTLAEVRAGVPRLAALRTLAEERAAWLSEVEHRKACAAD